MRLTQSLAFASALALAAAPAVATAAPVAPIAHTVKAPAKTGPVSEVATNYAQREAQDKQVANYEGGNVVVIGISGGALLVLLFLLLIL
jgi:hypothetical protein